MAAKMACGFPVMNNSIYQHKLDLEVETHWLTSHFDNHLPETITQADDPNLYRCSSADVMIDRHDTTA